MISMMKVNKMFRKFVKQAFRRVGFDLIRYNSVKHPVGRRLKLIDHHGIDLIFDIGANAGQFGRNIRELGYRGRIVSFEPVSSAYGRLIENASSDPLWETDNIALGNFDGESAINLAGNSFSSSLLNMLPMHENNAPESVYVGREKISVRKIDSIFSKYRRPDDKVYLKIDTQGFEKKVIEGAEQSLKDIIGVQMEVSLVPLYQGETLLADMIGFMSDKGFLLMSLEPGFSDVSTGRLLQVDCLFFRG